jgi:hypothetical protein
MTRRRFSLPSVLGGRAGPAGGSELLGFGCGSGSDSDVSTFRFRFAARCGGREGPMDDMPATLEKIFQILEESFGAVGSQSLSQGLRLAQFV